MFEQAMLAPQPQGRTAFTLLLSLTCQSALLGLAVLVPLLDPQSMPRTLLANGIPRPAPPPAAAPPALANAVRLVAAKYVRQWDGLRLTAPVSVPDKPAMIDDTDLPQLGGSSGGVQGGVQGGIPAGVLNGVLGSFITHAPAAPPPPAPAAKPPEEPKPVPRVRRGGEVQEGMLVHRVVPVYPPLARAAGIGGVVRLQGVIGVDGRIQQLQVLSGHPLLVRAALDAVRQWVYRPTLLNGDPVEVVAPIEVRFLLSR